MGSEPGASPATFGEFGAAALAEVFTPWFLQRQLDAALYSLRRRSNWLPDFAAALVSARAATPTLLSDDGFERSFAVTVRAVIEVEVGPRLLGMSVDATAEIDLTVRVRTFRPAIAQLHVDPVTSRNLRVRTRTRAGLLPHPLSGGGTRPLGELVERSLPIFAGALNRTLAATAVRRQFDVLDRIRQSQAGFVDPVEPGTGTPLPGRPPEWPDELPEQERHRTDAGERIGFAEFGEALLRLGIDRDTVSSAVGEQLSRGPHVEFDVPKLLRGTVGARLTDVTAVPPGDGELRFRLSLLVELELTIGPGSGATVLTSTLNAQVPLRVSTMTGPATLLVTFDPVSAADLQLVEPPRQVSGRRIPLLKRAVAELLPRRIAAELNRRLAEASRRIVAAELVTDRPEPVPEPGPDDGQWRPRVASAGGPGDLEYDLQIRPDPP
jgi:hypothetical protein